MKKLIEGVEILPAPPKLKEAQGGGLRIPLAQGLVLTDAVIHSPTFIQGAVGSGKSYLLHQIADAVTAHAAQSGDTCVFFVTKPDMLAYRRPGDPLISYSSQNESDCWNAFEEMRASPDSHAMAREISASLFREAKLRTNNRFFPQSAQEIFYSTLNYLYRCGQVCNHIPSNWELVEFLSTTRVASQPRIPGWIELATRHPQFFSCILDYIGKTETVSSNQGLGVLGELRSNLLAEVFVGSFAKPGSFSVRKAMNEPGKRIFVQFDFVNAPHASLTLIGVIMDLIYKEALRPDRQQKTYLFLDESHYLSKSPYLADLLSFGRDPSSCGRGGARVFMASQSAMLFTDNYSELEARTLLSLFPNVISFRVSDPMSRAVISDRYGEARYQETIIGPGGKPQVETFSEKVVSDYQFSKVTGTGRAIVSMPAISDAPFFYDGYIK